MAFKVANKEDVNKFEQEGGTVIRKSGGKWLVATDGKFKYYAITTSPTVEALLENGKSTNVKVKLPLIKINLDSYEISIDNYSTITLTSKEGQKTNPISLNMSLNAMTTVCFGDNLQEAFKETLKEKGIWVVE